MSKKNSRSFEIVPEENLENVEVETDGTVVPLENHEVDMPAIEIEEAIEPESSSCLINGYVRDCTKLNVREKPDSNSTVICVIDKNSSILVDENNSIGDWFKICLETGIEGFCMKKFIGLNNDEF